MPRRGQHRLAALTGTGTALTLLLLLSPMAASSLAAQGSRLSAGYTLRNYQYSSDSNPDFGAETAGLNKGSLQVEYLQYLTGFLYASAGGSYALHGEDEFLAGGPVKFDRWHAEGLLGLELGALGFFGGVRQARIGDLGVRARGSDGKLEWVPPSGSDSRWTTSVGGGIRYFLLPVVEVKAQAMTPLGDPVTLEVAPGGASAPAFRSAELDPTTFSLSLSLSVPFGGSGGAGAGGGRSGPLPAGSEGGESVSFLDPLPRSSTITSRFGAPRGAGAVTLHEGLDLDARTGDPVRAAAAGEVVRAGRATGYGKMVKIRHRAGWTTVYGHLSQIDVQFGQRVDRGDRIGKAGSTGHSTGSHLHFEVAKGGKPVNPVSVVTFR